MEEDVKKEIEWGENGLVPAVVQDARTGQVLMLAYMNRDALERTLSTGESWFWSRSRGELWHKGETSGNTQRVLEVRYDCDSDALLLLVEPAGPACHTWRRSCFYRRLPGGEEVGDITPPFGILGRLDGVIQDRKVNPPANYSYTCELFDGGVPLIMKKVGEELVEVLVAAQGEGDARLASEMADLVYHSLVLLAARNMGWGDVERELARRFK